MRLLDIINTLALTQPGKTALNDCSGTAVTYAQLMDLSGRVYHYLKERGIGREDMVNILLPRGTEPFIAMIGVWRAGAACVMRYPGGRLSRGAGEVHSERLRVPAGYGSDGLAGSDGLRTAGGPGNCRRP